MSSFWSLAMPTSSWDDINGDLCLQAAIESSHAFGCKLAEPNFVQFLDGATLLGLQSLNKPVRESLQEETHVLSIEKPRFIHGSGLNGSSWHLWFILILAACSHWHQYWGITKILPFYGWVIDNMSLTVFISAYSSDPDEARPLCFCWIDTQIFI